MLAYVLTTHSSLMYQTSYVVSFAPGHKGQQPQHKKVWAEKMKTNVTNTNFFFI